MNTYTKRKCPRIKSIARTSSFFDAGLRAGDFITAVNGETIEDELDFDFYTSHENLAIQVQRKKQIKNFDVHRIPGEFHGIDFFGMNIKRCSNRCIFCFIDQLPKGLRKSLYLKDEDYRHSFLYGNYITLCGITPKETKRIIDIGLSPLYVSVHATDPATRIKILNNKKAGDILVRLRELSKSGIAFHTQIVVCPGINDGKILGKTLRDLLGIRSGLLSIAVVPVGLTKFGNKSLRPVSRQDAQRICNMVEKISEKDKKKSGKRRLFIADELFLRAGIIIPKHGYYEDYPQIENGVGLLSQLMNEWRAVKKEITNSVKKNRKNRKKILIKPQKQFLLLTSISAEPFLRTIAEELTTLFETINFVVKPVLNTFLGESVTVAGLLTAHDIVHSVKNSKKLWHAVVIPQVVLNYRGYTLDGFSPARIAKTIGTEVLVVQDVNTLTDLIMERLYEKQ